MPAYVKPPDMLMLCLPPSGIYSGAKRGPQELEGRETTGRVATKIGERRRNGLLRPTHRLQDRCSQPSGSPPQNRSGQFSNRRVAAPLDNIKTLED